jgi:hypothetical protein
MRRCLCVVVVLSLTPLGLGAQSPVIPGPGQASLWLAQPADPGLAARPVRPLSHLMVAESRRSHWQAGMAVGAVVLGLTGAAFGHALCHGLADEPDPRCGRATVRLGLMGGFVGGVIGALIGGAIHAD